MKDENQTPCPECKGYIGPAKTVSDTPLFDVLYGELPPLQPKRDWPEDASHENGNYRCQCIYCAEYFLGHKRRFICKLCDGKPGETVASAPNND